MTEEILETQTEQKEVIEAAETEVFTVPQGAEPVKNGKSVGRAGKGIGGKLKRKLIKKLVCIILAAVIVAGLVLFVKAKIDESRKETPRVTTVTASSLEKVLEVSQLSTMNFTYNAVACVRSPEGDPRYYVAYEGVVTAGIDASKVEILVDDEAKIIRIKLPEVEIQNVYVHNGSLEYIFVKKKYNTAEIAPEAYEACTRELRGAAGGESLLFSMAKENAQAEVKAMFAPWIAQLSEPYTLEVK